MSTSAQLVLPRRSSAALRVLQRLGKVAGEVPRILRNPTEVLSDAEDKAMSPYDDRVIKRYGFGQISDGLRMIPRMLWRLGLLALAAL